MDEYSPKRGIVTMLYDKIVRPIIAKKPQQSEAVISKLRSVSSGDFMSDLDAMISRSQVAQQKRSGNA